MGTLTSEAATSVETPTARLLTDRRRSADRAEASEAYERIEFGAVSAVEALAARTATSPEVVIYAGFAALLARYTAQPLVVFAVQTDGSPPVVLDVEVSTKTPFEALVGHVSRVVLTSGRSSASSASLAEALWSLGGRLCVRVNAGEHPTTDVEYDTSVFVAETMQRLVTHYRLLLLGAVAAPELEVSELPMMSAEEIRTTLVTWNDTHVDLPLHDGTIHGAFARQATQRPEATAVIDGEREITYAEIQTRSNQLANYLREFGVHRGARVGLALHRSPEFLVAALAVMKAGGAYVPLDPAYPPARLRSMIDDAECMVVITCADLAESLGAAPLPKICTDTDAEAIAACDSRPPLEVVGPDDVCYVIYTSGSTGRPKGIQLRHAGVLNNLVDLNSRFQIGPEDAVLALSSLSFDMSVYEFFGVAVAGGTIVLPARTRTRNPSHWVELIRAHQVTVWNSAPALLELLVTRADRMGADLTSLRLALVGGDWIPVSLPDRLRAYAPGLRFIGLGGATEASIHSIGYEVTRTDPAWTSIPYGRPLANQRAYVLDTAGRPVPIGVPGELHLAGNGLALGYVGDPALTAARFIEWSCGPVKAERLYRTGDLARHRADGQLELLGRMDFQVKIRGIRIETADVEAALLAHHAVQACVVAACGGSHLARKLVAYVVQRPGGQLTDAELREHATTLLPAAFVPAKYVLLDTLPLSSNGKVDRNALPVPGRTNDCGVNHALRQDPTVAPSVEPPRGVWEQGVAEAWQDILGTGPVSRDSDFYNLGGDSLAAMRVVQILDPDLAVAELLANPTVKGLAARLRARAEQTEPDLD